MEGIHGERTPARKRRAPKSVVEEGVTGVEAEAKPERPLRPPTYDVGVEGEERPTEPGKLPGPPRYGGVPGKARPEGGIVVPPSRQPTGAPGVIPGEKPGERELEAERPGIPSVTPVPSLVIDRRPGIPDKEITDRISPDVEYEENKPTKKAKELTDSLFENYVPSVKIKGAQKHPAPIAESAAMAAVDAPGISYKPRISQELISSGKISDIQLEFIAEAGEIYS